MTATRASASVCSTESSAAQALCNNHSREVSQNPLDGKEIVTEPSEKCSNSNSVNENLKGVSDRPDLAGLSVRKICRTY